MNQLPKLMSKSKIYEHDWLYSALRPYVDWCCRRSYRSLKVDGYENIPQDGAVIIAPNHCNTLMDALVILQAFKDETVFGARADMFKKPLVAKIMFFLRIVPMVRQRDGLKNVLKNYETIDTIVESLEHKVRFCLYPEGRHRPMHSLLPLGKGLSRVAIAAVEKIGSRFPVYVIPTGIEYGDHFRFRSTCKVHFGQAINVTEILSKEDVPEAQQADNIRRILFSKMILQKTYIPDDENLPMKWTITKIISEGDNVSAVSKMQETFRTEGEDFEKAVLNDAAEFERRRLEGRFSIYSYRDARSAGKLAAKSLISIILAPAFLLAAILSLPIWGIFEFLKPRIKDRAFHNTAGYGVRILMEPLTLIFWAALSFSLLKWLPALLLTLCVPFSYNFFYDGIEFYRRWISDLRLAIADKEGAGVNLYDRIRGRFGL